MRMSLEEYLVTKYEPTYGVSREQRRNNRSEYLNECSRWEDMSVVNILSYADALFISDVLYIDEVVNYHDLL